MFSVALEEIKESVLLLGGDFPSEGSRNRGSKRSLQSLLVSESKSLKSLRSDFPKHLQLPRKSR